MKIPTALRDEAEVQAYKYFDENIRELPKNSDEKIKPLITFHGPWSGDSWSSPRKTEHFQLVEFAILNSAGDIILSPLCGWLAL